MASLLAFFISTASAQTAQGDQAVEKRGFKFLGRVENKEPHIQLTGSTHKDFYARIVKSRQTVEILSVEMPPPATFAQFLLGRYAVDCDNGAIKWLTSQSFDAVWSPTTKQVDLKGAKWQLPGEQTVTWHAVKATCS